ncbi:MAG: tRNA (5-methylaminomethyl-2-thiouridine)(34)-methyltransferase MnmD [Gammaproteobacteria bacterium]|nr:tRNA (5-methylaminomethyl-2-thiouridine)(34)-methyltransferase MnmD [Gammaproteobacteria bacterium]
MPDPDIVWNEGRLHSERFRDIYFAHDGPAETRRVFIEPANLIERMRDEATFSVMEFGFGTGLNFLTLARMVKDSRIHTRIRYISIDKYPLQSADIARALNPYRNELELVDALLSRLPPRIPGWHRRYFSDPRLELTLCYNDVATALDEFLHADKAGIDAWFLDGFAPDRNPDMWQPDLLEKMKAITKTGGTVTTFSAAGRVRSSLQQAGFQARRIEGKESQKRHTTLATLEGRGINRAASPTSVQVIGGGLAGTTVAQSLARKGVSVELLEREDNVGTVTSSIPAAIQHPRLSAADTLLALFRIHAYAHAQTMLKGYDAVSTIGALHLPDDGMSVERLSDVAKLLGNDWMDLLDSDATHDLIGRSTRSAWFPRSAIVHGARLCKELAHHERIQVSTSTDHEISTGDVNVATIYATGCDIPNRVDAIPIEAIVIPGQVDEFSLAHGTGSLHHVVAHNGYVAPQHDTLFGGSTYEYSPWPEGDATRTNRLRIESLFPDLSLEHKSVFRANRVVSSDRLPIVGEIANDSWVSWAHGSGGTITAPFAAELIASAMLKEMPPGSIGIPRLLSPDRFRIRQQRRPNPLTRGFRTGSDSD